MLKNWNKDDYKQDFPEVGNYNWKVVEINLPNDEYLHGHKHNGVLLHNGNWMVEGGAFILEPHEFKILDHNPLNLKNDLVKHGMNLSPVEMSKTIKQRVMDGDLNPLEVHASMKKLEKVVKEITGDKELKELVNEEAQRYGGKEFAAYGCKMIKTATSTKYDYKPCAHPKLNAINRAMRELDTARKEIEKELKELGPDQEKEIVVDELPKLVWETSGEMATVYGPQKSQTYGIKVFT